MNQHICRICFEEQQENRKLISPCKCSGSSKYVHYDCLETWRNTTSNELAKKKCMECNAPYIIVNKFLLETIKINTENDILIKNFFIQYFITIPLILCIFAIDWATGQPSVKLLDTIQTTNITNYLKTSTQHTFIYYNSLGSSLIYFLFNMSFFFVMLVCVHQKCNYLKVLPICFFNSLLSLSWFYFYFIFIFSQNSYFYFTLLTPLLNYLFLLLTFTYHNFILSMLNTNNIHHFLEYPQNTNSNQDFMQISMNSFYHNEIENEPLIQEIRELPLQSPVPSQPPHPPPHAIHNQLNFQHRNNFSNVLSQIQNEKTILKRRSRISEEENNEYTMIRINEHMTKINKNLQQRVIQELRINFDTINSQK